MTDGSMSVTRDGGVDVGVRRKFVKLFEKPIVSDHWDRHAVARRVASLRTRAGPISNDTPLSG